MSMTPDLTPLKIKSLHHDYLVNFHANLTDACQRLQDIPESVCIVDKRVASLHAEALSPLLSSRPVLEIDALESTKTLSGVEQVINWMLENGCTRSSTVIAIGGGIIQDVATFTSHI